MRAFISYSHHDDALLQLLHKHLAQLQRDGLITAWSDNEISAGEHIDSRINHELRNSGLFLALLSPDYIASRYCFETEFQRALELQKEDKIIIVPIIADSCDWLNTPFKEFKALPKDGKAISTWENKNTALLDAVQSIRKLLQTDRKGSSDTDGTSRGTPPLSRNYRVQRDFDSIEKMEFIEKTFLDIKEYLKRYVQEILQLENIKARVLRDDGNTFESILVNRNKIDTESQLKVTTAAPQKFPTYLDLHQRDISYSIITSGRSSAQNTFRLSSDPYRLFWLTHGSYVSQPDKECDSQAIAETIWNEWLESVGIL